MGKRMKAVTGIAVAAALTLAVCFAWNVVRHRDAGGSPDAGEVAVPAARTPGVAEPVAAQAAGSGASAADAQRSPDAAVAQSGSDARPEARATQQTGGEGPQSVLQLPPRERLKLLRERMAQRARTPSAQGIAARSLPAAGNEVLGDPQGASVAASAAGEGAQASPDRDVPASGATQATPTESGLQPAAPLE